MILDCSLKHSIYLRAYFHMPIILSEYDDHLYCDGLQWK